MFPVVCVLHSHDGQFAPSLVANAACAVTALFQSVLGAAPDFVPCMAVLRTDPARGTQFLYSASLPDSNHAVRRANVYAVSSAINSAAAVADNDDVTSAFLGRAASLVVESIVAGTQPAEVEAQADAWNCLAGALLTALCFLNRHGIRAGVPLPGSDAAQAASLAPAARRRGCVLVFSDCLDTAAVSFVAECAFSVAAVALARARVTLSCFGAAVAATRAAKEVADDECIRVSAAARLRALAASLEGICASHFTPDQLVMLLAPASNEDAAGSVSAAAATPRAEADAAQRRQNTQRARLTEQYVVTPTMLPQRPTKVPTLSTHDERAAAAVAADDEEEEAMPGIGWLCPRCMAIVQHPARRANTARGKVDTTDEAQRTPSGGEDNDEDEEEAELGVVCPYCDVDR